MPSAPVVACEGGTGSTVSAGVELRKLRVRGASGLQATANRTPIQLQLMPLYNPTEGYGSYVVPAVAVLIVHQTLLMAIAMWTGTWFETRRSGPLAHWWPRLGASAALGLASGAWFFQAAFRLFDEELVAVADEAHGAVGHEEEARYRGADLDRELLRPLFTLTNVHRLLQVEDDPDVACRVQLE